MSQQDERKEIWSRRNANSVEPKAEAAAKAEPLRNGKVVDAQDWEPIDVFELVDAGLSLKAALHTSTTYLEGFE